MLRLDAERIRILRDLDVSAALACTPKKAYPRGGPKDNGEFADTREIVLAAMHKMRVLHVALFTDDERAASRHWLTANGWATLKHGDN